MKKYLEMSSFYTSVQKIMIRWCTGPEIWCTTDRWMGRKSDPEVSAPPKKQDILFSKYPHLPHFYWHWLLKFNVYIICNVGSRYVGDGWGSVSCFTFSVWSSMSTGPRCLITWFKTLHYKCILMPIFHNKGSQKIRATI